MLRASEVYAAQPNSVRYILAPQSDNAITKQERAAIWIGPEGGFSSKENQMAQEFGWIPTSLGQNILRADTAAVVAVASFFRV